jgi:hypothetical protein
MMDREKNERKILRNLKAEEMNKEENQKLK